jgi:hypothetical protein
MDRDPGLVSLPSRDAARVETCSDYSLIYLTDGYWKARICTIDAEIWGRKMG